MFTVEEFMKDIFIIDDSKVRVFLIKGEDESILIDTGFGNNDLLKEIRKITQTKIKVILTHADGDHRGGIVDFKECYVHKGDRSLITEKVRIKAIKEGESISIAEYNFQVIEIPGHTYGSIALLDMKQGILIPGDTIQIGPIYMFGEHRNLDMYIVSIRKLLEYKECIKVILPSHHQLPLDNNYIEYCLKDSIALRNNKLPSKECSKLPCREYIGRHISFYF